MENMIYTALRVINLLNFPVFCDLGGICHCVMAVPRLFSFVHIFVLQIVDESHDIEKDENIHLMEIMSEKENKIFVFAETKRRCNELTREMRRDGWPAMGIHGDESTGT